MKKETQLLISKDVTAGNEDCDTYIPANGVEINITDFHGEGAFDPNAAVKLIWDYSGGGEEILWTIKGSSQAPIQFKRTGDGVKKIAICLDNGMSSGSVFMSGYANIIEET